MKPTHTHKIISLLLAMAMTCSLAGSALGAELDTTEALADAAASSETTDSTSEDWDTLPVTDDSEEESADSATDETTAEEEEISAEDAENTEAAEDSAADAEEAEPVAEDEPLVTDLETTEADDTLVFALGEDDESWVYTLDENSDPTFAFVYLEDGSQVFAADGFYLLPAGTVTVVKDEVTYTYSFAGGIYYFDENGVWQQELSVEVASFLLTTVEEEDGDLVVSDTDDKVLELDGSTATTVTWATDTTCEISSNIEFFSGKATFNSRYYYEGELYSGLFRFSSSGTLYLITDGVGKTFTGTMKSSYGTYICNYTLVNKYDGLYYKSGKAFTGLRSTNHSYYTKGKVDTSVSGWKTISSKEYYFTKGVAATGTKRIKRNGYTYTYTFRSDGTLVTNLFSYNSSYKKKKLHIVLARGSHTGTILAYNSSTKKYDIPVKSFVVSMSRKSSNTKAGTYKLTQRKRWWKYSSKLYYQYATYVSGSGSWTHSEQYSKASVKALKYSSYNGLGTNQSKQCIRMQVVNCKLIYDLGKSNNSNTRVVITKGNGYLPFGKMTLSNNYDATGKIKSSQKYDPTDPAV